MMNFFLTLFLLLALFLEGTVTTLPLVLLYVLFLTIQKRDAIVFPVAFFAGLLLDLLTVRTMGITSLFFIIFIFLVFLYQRKYEIDSYPFVGVAIFLGSALFLSLFSYGNWFWQSLVSMLIGLILFPLLRLSFRL